MTATIAKQPTAFIHDRTGTMGFYPVRYTGRATPVPVFRMSMREFGRAPSRKPKDA